MLDAVVPGMTVGFGLIVKFAVVIVVPVVAESDGVPSVMTGVWFGFDGFPQPVWAAKFWLMMGPFTYGWATPSANNWVRL